MRIGILSEKYEGGGPATVSTGEGDSGGVSYGTYQLTTGNVGAFVDWLLGQGGIAASYAAMLAQYPPGCLEFSNQWIWIANNWPDFGDLQDEYVRPRYYDAAAIVAGAFGIDTENLPFALQAVLFANAIQHGPENAGELLYLAYDPDPATWIAQVYDTKINDPDWSSGAPTLRPGLFARWESEKQDAIKLLEVTR